jgi:HlyD family secretion protein
MTMNKYIKLAIPLILLAALIAWRLATHPDFRYNGTVEATDVNLSPRISSTISTVTVQEGDVVKPGQELVDFGCEDLKLAADLAAHDFERSDRLYKVGSTPFETFDRDRNRRDMTALNVSWCKIYAPIHGVVLARLREPGEWASPGVNLLTLADLDQLYVYAYVPQTVLYKVHPGDEVAVYLPEAGDKPRKGRVAFVRPEAEFTPKNVQTRAERERLVYGVKVMLDNADQVLKPGMPIEVALPQS